MMKHLIIPVVAVSAILAFSQPLSTEEFSTLDREVAGLMDAWIRMSEDESSEATGVLEAGTAVLRAEAALEAALLCGTEELPPEVKNSWVNYLKSSADCIRVFRQTVGSSDTSSMEDVLIASFARWETSGGEFLESVQSTR
jgi:hypothetical protein